ncbi:MAG: isopentenyl-diphosphate Delta-isomerase [Pseudomonadota bacterium]
MESHAIVSDDSELLVLVDSNDEEVGYADKKSCHDGDGILHRAFSLFVFNDAGEVLMQQRAPQKRLWPGYWSNSCCSHPREGEELFEAVIRRSEQELGFRVTPNFLYKFEYQARFENQGSEHELCSVFAANYSGAVNVNRTEIQDWHWIAPRALDQDLLVNPHRYTPWFKMEWQRINTEFQDQLG